MDIRPGTTLEGPNAQVITIESLLGRGGLGQVFLGRLPDSRRVAVKTVLTASLSEDELRALQNEAKSSLGIKHPNVIDVLFFEDGKASQGRPPYLVMEYVEGQNLREVIQRRKADQAVFDVADLRSIYLQIAEGMSAVNKRVVHRDLKPENVLVEAASGRLKIADFGLAKLVDAVTRSISFKGWGTRPYQAPEAFDAGPNTPAMDIYSAGVMFYELSALAWPVQPSVGDNSPLAWRNAHLLSSPKDIRTLRLDLPLDLVQLIMQMLQKNPAKRPRSWDNIIERLTNAGSTVHGRDVSALVSKATSTFIERSEQEVQLRQELELSAERYSLLERAFEEPVQILQELVDAFNSASSISKLELRAYGPHGIEVKNSDGRQRLLMRGEIIGDLQAGSFGIARILSKVELDPPLTPVSRDQAYRDRDSFGSFNLIYRVPNSTDRFGDWAQIRFEINPLMPESRYPRWFALSLDELPEQLRLLRAMGVYQHQQHDLDEEWFKALLLQIL